MLKENYFIPEKIEVAFQKRKDTFSGKLSYLTYINKKGILKCSKSWNNWGDKDIPNESIENIPTSGFMVNKQITRGGYRYRSEWVRISDPRGFDIEIPVENLIWILDYEGVVKGSKELTGEFVYSWLNEKDLILLPCDSNAYKDSKRETEKIIDAKISKSSLVPGALYKRSTYEEDVIFVGHFKLMKDYGNKFETVPLFSSGKKDLLFTISLSSLKYIKQRDVWSSKEIKEISNTFKKTAYSKEFWDNLSNNLLEFKIVEDIKKYLSNHGSDLGWYKDWINASDTADIYLGKIDNNGKTLFIGKPVIQDYFTKGSYYSIRFQKPSLNDYCFKFEINADSHTKVTKLDKLGPIDNLYRGGVHFYGSMKTQEMVYTSSEKDYKATNRDFDCIPVYVLTDGYMSDSLYVLARCDSFDKASRLNKFRL